MQVFEMENKLDPFFCVVVNGFSSVAQTNDVILQQQTSFRILARHNRILWNDQKLLTCDCTRKWFV